MSQPIRWQCGHLVFPIGTKNTNLVEDVKILLSFCYRSILCSGYRGESKMYQSIRDYGDHLVFRTARKNTNLVENVGFLLPISFSSIPFSSFREEVENVSAN